MFHSSFSTQNGENFQEEMLRITQKCYEDSWEGLFLGSQFAVFGTMHITDRLLSIIQELQGSEITGNFISHYEKTGFSFELRKPLLDYKANFSSRTSRFVQNIDSVDFSRIKRLSIYNNTSKRVLDSHQSKF